MEIRYLKIHLQSFINKIIRDYKERRCTQMIYINVKENESLDKALKKFKKKFEKTGVVKELRSRQAFTKKCIVKRHQVIRAAYKQQLQQAAEL